MYYYVISAQYKYDFKILIRFKDGLEGELDFSQEFDGLIFEPLKDIEFFKSFDLDGNTLHWQNGADFAPEYLYQLVLNRAAAIV